MDLFEKCVKFTAAKELMSTGFYPWFLPLEDTEGTEVTISGKKLVMIGSNNYLGLTTHPMSARRPSTPSVSSGRAAPVPAL